MDNLARGFSEDIETRQLSMWDDNSLVVKANPLIKSRIYWPLNAQKILLLMAASMDELTNLNGEKDVPDSERHFWSISVSSLEEQFDVKKLNSSYLKDLAKIMVDTSIEINLPNQNDELEWRVAPLIADAQYRDGILRLELTRLCKTQLSRLSTGYTQYALKNVIRLRSQYSIRLYELISAETFKRESGTVTYNLSDLRGLFGLKTEYAYYNNFKTRILLPAITEINSIKNGNLVVDFEQIKRGRSVVKIKFYYIDKKRITDRADDLIARTKYKYNFIYDEARLFGFIKPMANHRKYDWEYFFKLAISVIDKHRQLYLSLKEENISDNFIIMTYMKDNYYYSKKYATLSFSAYYKLALINNYANSIITE